MLKLFFDLKNVIHPFFDFLIYLKKIKLKIENNYIYTEEIIFLTNRNNKKGIFLTSEEYVLIFIYGLNLWQFICDENYTRRKKTAENCLS